MMRLNLAQTTKKMTIRPRSLTETTLRRGKTTILMMTWKDLSTEDRWKEMTRKSKPAMKLLMQHSRLRLQRMRKLKNARFSVQYSLATIRSGREARSTSTTWMRDQSENSERLKGVSRPSVGNLRRRKN